MTEHKGELIAARRDDARSLDVPAQHLHGRMRTWRETITADFAQNDTIDFGSIPSHAVLSSAHSELGHTAFGAAAVLDIGFADDANLGVTGKTAALASDLDLETAGTKKFTDAVAIGDRHKQAWELAGLSADPKVALKVIGTLQGANPPSGMLALDQEYVTD